VYCPEGSIIVEDGKVIGIDMKHCKGCGICAKECPEKIKAIKMVNENE
jgi:pyruvate ferredoxin oxidoreductase delta subunit